MNINPLATRFATAVAERDPDRIASTLTDSVRLRALLPGGAIEEHGIPDVIRRFASWFASYRTVVLDDVAGDSVGDRVLVHYKLIFEPDGDRRVLTQTAVCGVQDGRIFRIDLVCSGFREF